MLEDGAWVQQDESGVALAQWCAGSVAGCCIWNFSLVRGILAVFHSALLQLLASCFWGASWCFQRRVVNVCVRNADEWVIPRTLTGSWTWHLFWVFLQIFLSCGAAFQILASSYRPPLAQFPARGWTAWRSGNVPRITQQPPSVPGSKVEQRPFSREPNGERRLCLCVVGVPSLPARCAVAVSLSLLRTRMDSWQSRW